MQKSTKRNWLPWEINRLRRHGFSTERADLEVYGEKPVEYITGWAEFRNKKVKVEERTTLIPRIETEGLVDLVLQDLDELIKKQNSIRIAEIGTGTGVIALSLAGELLKQGFNNFEIIAADKSKSALKVAQANQELWGIDQNHLKLVNSDLWSTFPQSSRLFDLVVANLPYVPTTRKPFLEKSVIDYEPQMALFGGEDGLDLIKEFLLLTPGYINESAPVWLEVDDSHKPEQIFDFLNRLIKIDVYPDCYQKNRFWRLTKS